MIEIAKDMLIKAVDIVIDEGIANASLLQRRLGIGYSFRYDL